MGYFQLLYNSCCSHVEAVCFVHAFLLANFEALAVTLYSSPVEREYITVSHCFLEAFQRCDELAKMFQLLQRFKFGLKQLCFVDRSGVQNKCGDSNVGGSVPSSAEHIRGHPIESARNALEGSTVGDAQREEHAGGRHAQRLLQRLDNGTRWL